MSFSLIAAKQSPPCSRIRSGKRGLKAVNLRSGRSSSTSCERSVMPRKPRLSEVIAFAASSPSLTSLTRLSGMPGSSSSRTTRPRRRRLMAVREDLLAKVGVEPRLRLRVEWLVANDMHRGLVEQGLQRRPDFVLAGNQPVRFGDDRAQLLGNGEAVHRLFYDAEHLVGLEAGDS